MITPYRILSTDGRHLILVGLCRIVLKTYAADTDDDANGPHEDDMAGRWPPFYRKPKVRRGEAEMTTVLAETTTTTIAPDYQTANNERLHPRTGERGVHCFINVQQARRRPHISIAVREPMTTLDRALFVSRVRRNRWNS